MKYYPRLKLYKASNVTFNPETFEAYSYRWFGLVKKINGFVVFNNYGYSMTTRKHQSKIRGLLFNLGIKIDLVVYLNNGLESYSGREALREAYYEQNEDRIKMIKKVFKVKLTRDEIQEIYNRKEENICDIYLINVIKREEKKLEKLEREKRLIELTPENIQTVGV